MRRLFIIRKDLHLSAGKLSAMLCHCSEAYWTRWISDNAVKRPVSEAGEYSYGISEDALLDRNIFENYINGNFVKTICEAKNLNHLLKVLDKAKNYGFEENIDYGFINDNCLTELVPENDDGTCTVGIWFKPLNDDIAHDLSKNYQLYKE